MKHRLLYIPIAFLFILSFVDCAKKGTPSGGPRDTIPPIIVRSSPENYSTNFTGDEIEIRFDEYIKLKDLTKELIISPPMKYAPIITPLNTSKTLKIKLIDTLKPNTTYSFNFGKSIVDNNEGNQFEYFKYIFSTGSYIDSLKLTGKVKDAQLIAPEIPTTVMLYEAGETFNDSLVFTEKPTYITVTKDSTGTFELTNLKEGNYLLLALKEKNNDYTFQPKNDKIGFVKQLITLPTDSSYTLTLFKEISDYKLARPSQVGKNHIVFGYEGRTDSLDIKVLSEVPQDYVSTVFKDEKTDTLHYWFKPAVETDSLIFKVTNRNEIDTTTIRMRELYNDSLKISAVKTGILKLKDTFKLRANMPLVSFDADLGGFRSFPGFIGTSNWSRLLAPSTSCSKYRPFCMTVVGSMRSCSTNLRRMYSGHSPFRTAFMRLPVMRYVLSAGIWPSALVLVTVPPWETGRGSGHQCNGQDDVE